MKIDFKQTELSNGLRVATAEMPHVASVSIGIWVGVGGRYENRRHSGLSHFIEHLLFKGTAKRSARDISQTIEGRGGYFNAFTQEESTCYYTRIDANYAWEAFDVLADMYAHPKLAADDIDKERQVVIEEIMMYRDRPNSAVEDMLGELLWHGHSLGKPLIGTQENIARVSRSEIAGFKAKRYVPGNTLVVFAGCIDHEACVAEVQKRLGRLTAKRRPTCSAVNARTPQKAMAVETRNIEQTHLALGVRLFGRHDARRFPLKLMNVVLGENMSSRLFQSIRERNGLAYSVHSSVNLFNETGTLAVQAGLDRRRIDRALGLVVKEMQRLKDRKIPGPELQRAKDYAIGQMRLSLESTGSQMMWIGENIMGYDRVTQPEKVISQLQKTTAEQIQKMANQVFRSNRVSVAIIAPEDKEAHEQIIARRLAEL